MWYTRCKVNDKYFLHVFLLLLLYVSCMLRMLGFKTHSYFIDHIDHPAFSFYYFFILRLHKDTVEETTHKIKKLRPMTTENLLDNQELILFLFIVRRFSWYFNVNWVKLIMNHWVFFIQYCYSYGISWRILILKK